MYIFQYTRPSLLRPDFTYPKALITRMLKFQYCSLATDGISTGYIAITVLGDLE